MKKLLTLLWAIVALVVSPIVTTAQVATEDARGAIELPAKAERIVVLGFAEYDTLRALGLEDKIVGAPTQKVPEYIGKMPESVADIGTLKEPNFEVIAGLEPDLIIAGSRTRDLVPELEKIAPVFLFLLDTKAYWESFEKMNTGIATLVGEEAKAMDIIKDVHAKAEEVKALNAQNDEKSLVLMLNEGELSAFSANSRFALLYEVLGFHAVDQTIEESRHGQAISFEGVLDINPDRLFLLDRTKAVGGDTSKNDAVLENELIKQTKASQSNQVVELNPQLWYLSGGGLESTRLQIEAIADALK